MPINCLYVCMYELSAVRVYSHTHTTRHARTLWGKRRPLHGLLEQTSAAKWHCNILQKIRQNNNFPPHPKIWKNRDWAILIHGNWRYGYYKILDFGSKIEKCHHFFQHSFFGWFLTLDFFHFEKMTFLDFLTCIWLFLTYIVNIWSKFININQI